MTNVDGVEKFLVKAAAVLTDYEITRFIDSRGFSLIGEYGLSEKRQMGISGKSNIVPFSKFYFLDEDINEQNAYISLKVRISPTIREENGGSVRYIPDDSRFRIKPIELTTGDEFYVKRATGVVYEKKGNDYEKIDLNKLYNKIYKAHVSSILSLAGLRRRTKILIMRTLPRITLSLAALLSGCVFWWLKGKMYRFDVIAEQLSRDRRDDEIDRKASKLPAEQIDFFGYKVGVWTLTTFSIVIIILFSILKENMVFKLPDENVLSGVYNLAVAIVAIVFYDRALPKTLKFVVEKSENQAFNLRYNGVKFKI
jgi:hypothetical protein